MPSIQKADHFIERSLLLLQSSPATTRVSITYGSLSKKAEREQAKGKVSKAKADSFVSFKVYDPVSGTLYKLTTYKAKELSRVLTALGPHGVQITKSVKPKDVIVTKDEDGDVPVTDTDNPATTIQVRGFSSILANADIKEELEEEQKTEIKKDTVKKGKKKKSKR